HAPVKCTHIYYSERLLFHIGRVHMSRKLTYQEKILQMGKRHKKSAGKHVLIGLIFTVVFIVGSQIFFSPSTAEDAKNAESHVTAAGGGEMMCGCKVQEVTEKRGTAYLFDKMKPDFENAAYVTGNFENPVLKNDEEHYKKLEKQIHLHTDAEAVKTLKKMNFTTVNLANNHMMDYGEEGLQDTDRK